MTKAKTLTTTADSDHIGRYLAYIQGNISIRQIICVFSFLAFGLKAKHCNEVRRTESKILNQLQENQREGEVVEEKEETTIILSTW